MQALIKEGWEVYAICPEGEYHHRFIEHNIIHLTYTIDRGSLNPLKELASIRSISTVLKDLRPDLLHTFTAKPNIYGIIAGKKANVPHIYASVTGLGSFFIEKDFKSKIVKRLILTLYEALFKKATAVTFQNRDDLALFTKGNIVDSHKTKLIKGSGIDTTKWVSHHKNEDGVIRFLFVGRLLKHKGVLEFIEAATTLKEHYKHKVHFVIAGDYYDGNPYGLDKAIMQEAVQKRIIEFIGWQNDVKPLLQACDVFVLPSYREGLPRTAIEAASMGRAIITSNTVGCKECVDEGINGFLVPVQHSTKLASAMEAFVHKPELIHTMGKASRLKAEKEFDVSTIVKSHLKMYKEKT